MDDDEDTLAAWAAQEDCERQQHDEYNTEGGEDHDHEIQ